ncbi:hypothetical protein [Tenacibaculum mesophilum]|uniref:hypothetical protein n=1 Tax=Tenacibaculum mesophilum TaxID=104268 RepID=UPI002493CE03|nr:hypothetical protein [Tenacibaculum mesophilum]
MSILKKLFKGKSKKEKKDVKSNNDTSYKTTTMSASDLVNLKVGDTISFENPKEEEKVYDPKWLKPNENPYNIEIFDCREYALKMTSTTQDPRIATNFLNLRKSDGKEYIGKFPENGAKCEVDLKFNTQGKQIPDGIIYKASEMEEKWDIYKYANFLFFVRSWTGDLVYFSNYIPTEKGFNVNLIVLDDSKIAPEDPFFDFKVVEFLIHSHILGYNVPHPIPKSINKNNYEDILGYSFSMFGNKGLFATSE